MDSDKQPRVITVRPGKNKKGIITTAMIIVVVAVVAFVAGTRADSWHVAWLMGNPSTTSGLDFSSVEQTYQLLQQKFAGTKLDNKKLIEGAKRGLVAAAGDPYTVYFNDAEAKQFLGDLDGTFTGIGAELSMKDGKLVVVSTLDDSPAKKAGLAAGDNIVKVNDQDASTWSVDEAVAKIRGEKGTTVKLTVIRGGQNVQDFSIVRDTINNPSVTYSETPDNIGYIRISRFAQNDTAMLAKTAAAEFKAKGVKGVILDLRGDGGGYVNAAQSVASLWLGTGKTVVSERKDNKTVDELKTNDTATLEGVPTIVLIDGGSASASEIVAGALHDYKAARLVGAKSFGKGSVQEILDAPGGGQLKVTVALWFTPNGKNINHNGIDPDVAVPLTDAQAAAGQDPQKDKAIELLQ
ncbi:MAG TPA: S41 family peptidase [Candidatus Saccharimonadales bacterium]|jgi:carboxyl-terminal processing protease|nr:S41 family peptidase [Candidatus Saccharimonadales bacterium]